MPSRPPSAPREGWPRPDAPSGRLFAVHDLAGMRERALLGEGGAATLHAVGRDGDDYSPDRAPLVLIHGIAGRPADLQALALRLADGPYQIHALCYADSRRSAAQNGDDLARGLASLPPGAAARGVVIVAHSLGGLVARRALNRLVASGAAKGLGRLRLWAIDSPWQGFGSGAPLGGGRAAHLVRAVLPPGMRDLHVASPFFVGAPGSPDDVERAGLLGGALPGTVSIDLAFCAGWSPAWKPLGRPAAALPGQLAAQLDQVATGAPLDGDLHLVQLWRALAGSRQGVALVVELRARADRERLDEAAVREAIGRHFPPWPGDHNGCLREQPPGTASLIDHLTATLLGDGAAT